MKTLARVCSLALVIAFGQMAAAPAQAGGSVVISIGQGHYYGRGYSRHPYPYGFGSRRPFNQYGHFRPYRRGHGYYGYLGLPPIVLAPAPPAPATAALAPPPRQEYIDRTNCAPYTSEIVIDGQRQVLSGTACEQPDGRWRLIN